MGMTAVVDSSRKVLGIFTDGDLRRDARAQRPICTRRSRSTRVMKREPRTIAPEQARRRGRRADGASQDQPAARRVRRRTSWSARSTRTTCSAPRSSDAQGPALSGCGALKLMIFDVDGVLTDGTLYFSDTGEELKAFNARDGHGLKMLKESGVEVAHPLGAPLARGRRRAPRSSASRCVEQGARDKGAGVRERCARARPRPRRARLHGRRSCRTCRCLRAAASPRACRRRRRRCARARTTSPAPRAAAARCARSASSSCARRARSTARSAR